MKTEKEILLLSLLMVSLLVLVGCAKKADVSELNDEIIIEPLVGIGPVRFGSSKSEIIEHFGQPETEKIRAEGTKLNYVASKGLGFTVDAELGLQKIQCWSDNWPTELPFAVTTFTGRTKEGIGIGSTREQIIAAYGQPDRTSTDSNKGIIQGLHYDELRIEFAIWQDKLISMTLQAPK
ncbi:MAG: hypothetical protein ACYS17_05430 [Planctomycetota bacterium]|jgi:hypothetical protein